MSLLIEWLKTDPRVTIRRTGSIQRDGTCVIYWMQRAQRGFDNPALDLAIEAGNRLGLPVVVFFGLHPRYPNANLRHYAFLVAGLSETRERVLQRGAYFLFRPYPEHNLIDLCQTLRPALVVGDENPLRQPAAWRVSAAQRLDAPFVTVDADVIVPTEHFTKEEYAARTIRPKIHRLLPVYLKPLSNPVAVRSWEGMATRLDQLNRPIDAEQLLRDLPLDRSVSAAPMARGGSAAALNRLAAFIGSGLATYDTDRNQPHLPGTSELSAYLHFGQISPLTIALAVQGASAPEAARTAYLEELIVRRELAINFVKHNPNYDRLEGCHSWAVETLTRHAGDERPRLYSAEQLELAQTDDHLWNAAQLEMVVSGRMHGYLRMYWAKKILEWTPDPAEAFRIAVWLNDKYQLDGRDPNGYTGISWAIGGKHDRPWGPERKVFGLIRYMVYSGCARKFNVPAYIDRVARMRRSINE